MPLYYNRIRNDDVFLVEQNLFCYVERVENE